MGVPELAVGLSLAVRHARDRRGWRQVDLVQQAGVHRATISEIESGAGNPTLDVLERVARALGLTISELLRAAEVEQAQARRP